MDKKEIVKALSGVMDPEIGMDIVTLGLIYAVKQENDTVDVEMTLTFSGCPLANMMIGQAKEAVEALDGVKEVNINLVFEPKWNQTMISEENYKKLAEE